MAKKTDNKTLELIKEVNRRKAEIAQADKPNWKTNCSFSFVEGSSSSGAINLHVESNVQTLIKIAAFLINKYDEYRRAVNVLGVIDAPNLTWNGFSIEDWTEDVKSRINKVQIASKRKALEVLESRLNAVISPELRAEMELQAIAEALN